MSTEYTYFRDLATDPVHFLFKGCCSFVRNYAGKYDLLFRSRFSRKQVEGYIKDILSFLPEDISITFKALNPRKFEVNKHLETDEERKLFNQAFYQDPNISEGRAVYVLTIDGPTLQGKRKLWVHTAMRYLWSTTGAAILTVYFEAKKYLPAWEALMVAEKAIIHVPPVHDGEPGPYGKLTYTGVVPRDYEEFTATWTKEIENADNTVHTLTGRCEREALIWEDFECTEEWIMKVHEGIKERRKNPEPEVW